MFFCSPTPPKGNAHHHHVSCPSFKGVPANAAWRHSRQWCCLKCAHSIPFVDKMHDIAVKVSQFPSRILFKRLLLCSTMKPLTVVVEGNIGSGKTTFLKHFQKLPDYSVLDEPVDKWRDVQGHNLFDMMYKNPKKWSMCFQSYVQLTMLDLHTKPVTKPVKMIERSIFSAKYCFVNNLRDSGLMNDAEYAVLTEWFDFIMEAIPLKIDLIVYLKTDPEIVHKRVGLRGRSEEDSISLDYLKSIHKLHEDWLFHKKFGPVPPVLTIDANEDLSKMMEIYSICEETIIQKVAVANC